MKDNMIWQRPRGKNKGGFYTDKSPTLSANAWQENNLVMELSTKQLNPSGESNNRQQPYQQNNFSSISSTQSHATISENKSTPLVAAGDMGGGNVPMIIQGTPQGRIRRLTPTECARLQTIPEWYKWQCSNTQRYKMLGNGWTVEVIKHILSFLPGLK